MMTLKTPMVKCNLHQLRVGSYASNCSLTIAFCMISFTTRLKESATLHHLWTCKIKASQSNLKRLTALMVAPLGGCTYTEIQRDTIMMIQRRTKEMHLLCIESL